MATLKAEVVELEIEEHPNADALEIAKVRGYQSIVRKGQYDTGDLAVYIPEQSLVPEWVLRRLNLWDDEKGKGGLAGKQGDRVKPIKLRGVLSQGLIFPLEKGEMHLEEDWAVPCYSFTNNEGEDWAVFNGQDVTDLLGITKWEPPIPAQMSGEVVNLHGKTIKYDIENVKNYPEIVDSLINLGIPCQITEKLHGTWCCFGIWPEDLHDEIPYKRVIVTSKGLSGKGLAFKNVSANDNNIYLRMFKKMFPTEREFSRKLKYLAGEVSGPIYFVGEIFGKGIQDLTYGLNDMQFRLFDIFSGKPFEGGYYPTDDIETVIDSMELPFEKVPVLYEGPLTWDIIQQYTDGIDNITNTHMREGIVIRTLDREYTSPTIGRVILKSVSEDYLDRKNATEYN